MSGCPLRWNYGHFFISLLSSQLPFFKSFSNSKTMLPQSMCPESSTLVSDLHMYFGNNAWISFFHRFNYRLYNPIRLTSDSALVVQGASGAVNAIMLLDMFLFPKSTILVEFIIPVPAILLVTFIPVTIRNREIWVPWGQFGTSYNIFFAECHSRGSFLLEKICWEYYRYVLPMTSCPSNMSMLILLWFMDALLTRFENEKD